jgi:hypothetical protein
VKDIEALFVGHMGESYEHQGHTGPKLAEWASLLPKPAIRVESACASSGSALRAGILAILWIAQGCNGWWSRKNDTPENSRCDRVSGYGFGYAF